jgi:hemophore-related protein
MFTHPDVNAFFSSLRGQPRDQMRSAVQNYMASNPQVLPVAVAGGSLANAVNTC